MVHSMTAFARCEVRSAEGTLGWEIRSVNHRFLELSLRLPEGLRALEPSLRSLVTQRLGRGKVECSLRLEAAANAAAPFRLNLPLASQLLGVAAEVDNLIHQTVPLRTMDVLSWPGVLEVEAGDLGEQSEAIIALLEETLGELQRSRAVEGERMAQGIRQRCVLLRQLVIQARERIPEVLAALRRRLHERLAEVIAQLDPGRLEQELLLLTQRLDVAEEMERLVNHLDEVEQTLERNEPIGRRLDFLMQELNREANTLGAKSNDLELTRCAVEMKILIEQMREQIQNVE